MYRVLQGKNSNEMLIMTEEGDGDDDDERDEEDDEKSEFNCNNDSSHFNKNTMSQNSPCSPYRGSSAKKIERLVSI
jgi:hypothetical protein